MEQNAEKVSEILSEVHNENTSVIQYNDENSLSCMLALAYYSAQDSYAIYRELQGGEGFADLVFVPKAGNSNPAMIIELKWNKNTGIALNQIKDKKYIKSLKDYHGKVLFAGINYDKKSKKHECRFETTKLSETEEQSNALYSHAEKLSSHESDNLAGLHASYADWGNL